MSRSDAARSPWPSLKRFTWRLLGVAGLLAAATLLASCREPQLLPHFYYVNEVSSWESFQANVAQIGLLSPQWFAVNKGGQVLSTVDPAVVDLAAQHGIPVMPLLVNEGFQAEVAHALLNDDRIQQQVISLLLQAAAEHHFRGFQLDLENVPAADRDRYTGFVRRLAKELHRRRLKLSLAVPPPLVPAPVEKATEVPVSLTWLPSETSLAFDYRKLAKDADSLSLMAYDQYYTDPGPVAGLPWVEACLQETLRLVSRKKLSLGVPLYYRHWAGKEIEEGPYSEALRVATERKLQPLMDPIHRELRFRFNDGETPNIFWLQDAESIRERVDLARKYRLYGFSAWRLGQEDSAAWSRAFPPAAEKRAAD